MNSRLASVRCGLVVAAWVLGGLDVCHGQGALRSRGQAIEFSEPKSGELTNSLRQLSGKKDGLRQLEEDLFKPLRTFGSEISDESVFSMQLPAPRGQVTLSKRERDQEERRKNWAFMKPEDLMGVRSMEELLQTAEFDKDGREKQSLSLLEQYFMGDSPRADATKKSNKKAKERDRFGNGPLEDSANAAGNEETERPDLPNGLGESEKSLKQLIGSKANQNAFDRPNGAFADIFGLSRREPTREELLAHKERMEEFRRVLDPSWKPPGDKDALNSSITDSFSRSAGAAAGLNGLPGSSRQDLPGSSPGGNPLLATGLPDLGASLNAPTAPKWMAPLPKVELPSVTPPIPSFLAPRRQF